MVQARDDFLARAFQRLDAWRRPPAACECHLREEAWRVSWLRFGGGSRLYRGRLEDFREGGDGVVFENASDTNNEQGGRIYEVRGSRFYFRHGGLDFRRIAPGTRVWKTSDPALDAELRKTHTARIETEAEGKTAIRLKFSGSVGTPLTVEVDGLVITSQSELQASEKQPLKRETLEDIFRRLNETPYVLEGIDCEFSDGVFLPKSELTKLRQAMVLALDDRYRKTRTPSGVKLEAVLGSLISEPAKASEGGLHVLCRTMDQISASIAAGVETIYADFEDIRRYKDAVDLVRDSASTIFLATPRIQKAGEQGFFKLIENASPDGVLIRNVGAIAHFAESPLRRIGDFSLNVANPATAAVFMRHGLERLTISYDLNIGQVLGLLRSAPPEWFELTIHQHMPMFHMEHCVFAAFLSEGKSFLDCRRPCETHKVHLRDRVGVEHPLRADVGCRNTLFNAVPQTGAAHFEELRGTGLRHFRVELLEEDKRRRGAFSPPTRRSSAGGRRGGSLAQPQCAIAARRHQGNISGCPESSLKRSRRSCS